MLKKSKALKMLVVLEVNVARMYQVVGGRIRSTSCPPLIYLGPPGYNLLHTRSLPSPYRLTTTKSSRHDVVDL